MSSNGDPTGAGERPVFPDYAEHNPPVAPFTPGQEARIREIVDEMARIAVGAVEEVTAALAKTHLDLTSIRPWGPIAPPNTADAAR
jgi:hypothetical protein